MPIDFQNPRKLTNLIKQGNAYNDPEISLSAHKIQKSTILQ